jgi:hypothetical protein
VEDRVMKKVIGGCVLLVVFGFAARAGAQEADETEVLGKAGHWSLSVDRLFGVDYVRSTPSMNGIDGTTTTSTNLSLFGNPAAGASTAFSFPRVAFDMFVGPGVSVGTGVSLFHVSESGFDGVSGDTQSLFGFVLAPRVGYVARLTPGVAFWPRAGITFLYATNDLSGSSLALTLSSYAIAATVEAPFAFNLTPHVAITFGPTFDLTLASKSTASQSGSPDVSTDQHILEVGAQAGLTIAL